MFKDDASVFLYVIDHNLRYKNFRRKNACKGKALEIALYFCIILTCSPILVHHFLTTSEAPITADLDIRAAFRRT